MNDEVKEKCQRVREKMLHLSGLEKGRKLLLRYVSRSDFRHWLRTTSLLQSFQCYHCIGVHCDVYLMDSCIYYVLHWYYMNKKFYQLCAIEGFSPKTVRLGLDM